ncbi:cell division protein SepF [Synechococcus sp. RSCCF101]|uniref:cell division protein SepF n=1 Tax=Synechococcus sp. RSCCF101 TaxID=2511069 RepID=UPI00351A37F0
MFLTGPGFRGELVLHPSPAVSVERPQEPSTRASSARRSASLPPSPATELLVLRASSFDDAASAIDSVRTGVPVVFDVSGLPTPVQTRLTDYLCGGVVLVGGSTRCLQPGCWLAAPMTRPASCPGKALDET